jgi:uncharacterized protein YndB with AHSA1/START domain
MSSKTHITKVNAGSAIAGGYLMPIPQSAISATGEEKTNPSTTQVTTLTASPGDVWRISVDPASTKRVWVTINATVTTGQTLANAKANGRPLSPGQTEYYGASVANEIVAVIEDV